jgi:hypothetical protein
MTLTTEQLDKLTREDMLALVIRQQEIIALLQAEVAALKAELEKFRLCWKHGSLRGKTPAQATGLTGHQWTLRELLTFNASISSKIT